MADPPGYLRGPIWRAPPPPLRGFAPPGYLARPLAPSFAPLGREARYRLPVRLILRPALGRHGEIDW